MGNHRHRLTHYARQVRHSQSAREAVGVLLAQNGNQAQGAPTAQEQAQTKSTGRAATDVAAGPCVLGSLKLVPRASLEL